MSGLDIEAIRARYAAWEAAQEAAYGLPDSDAARACVQRAMDCGHDVPPLLAEIERLRGELLEEQTVHAKTMDNFESMAESALEEHTRQLDRYARLEARLETETKHLRAELDHQRRRADAAEADLNVMKSTEDGEAVVLRGERDQARAALADALQVIADLRGGTS